jgi:hypothetical protein
VREFPPIDRAAEAAVAQTVFFTDAEFEGRQIRASRANYLAFLSMKGAEIDAEIAKLRALFSEHPPDVLERDVACLLTARNWRVHNIACAVMAAGFVSDRSLISLWRCIHDGSWTSPQLVATAAYVDPEFESKGVPLLSDKSTYFKSIVPLAEILRAEHGWTGSEIAEAVANVQEARSIDRDNSGAIALGWLASLRAALGSKFERHS